MVTDQLWVIETYDGEAYVGQVELRNHAIIVHNGFVGRPPVIDQADVERVTLACDHPDVEVLSA